MDIVTSLPPLVNPITRKTYNTVLVIVDKFTKYTLYLATTKTLISSSLVELFLYYIVQIYRLPLGIVLD